MRERIDRERCVIERYGRDEEAPNQQLSTADEVESDGKHHRHQHIEAIEESQLRIPHEIADELGTGREVAAIHEPANVAPKESVLMRRVRIGGIVRMGVMVPMVRSPP